MDQRHTIRQHILDAYWCNRVDRPRRCGPLFHLKNQERATRPRARVPKKRTGIRNGNFAQPRPQSALGDGIRRKHHESEAIYYYGCVVISQTNLNVLQPLNQKHKNV